jgi:hypothetical protein
LAKAHVRLKMQTCKDKHIDDHFTYFIEACTSGHKGYMSSSKE